MKKKLVRRFNMRVIFTLLTMAEIMAIIAFAWFFTEFLHRAFSITLVVPTLVWILIISAVIGGTITNFLTIQFFDPITRLGRAMEQVAAGDFSVRLTTKNRFKEIRDIYGNFNLMTEELAAAEILQMDFISGVSHEFKTPVNAIEGYATLLSDDEPETPELQRQYAEKILLNTQRLSSLVGNVLLLSKVANQAIPIKQTTFRLDEQIRQALVMLEREWAPKDIEFDVELESVNYTGSEQLLPHVWSNLLGNAVKFTPVGGTIRMELTKQAHGIVFVIEDSGPGITEEVRRHMFDKFYQGDTSHKDEGNGLGLALVKHILDETGGTVQAENGPGGGCRITVILPNAH